LITQLSSLKEEFAAAKDKVQVIGPSPSEDSGSTEINDSGSESSSTSVDAETILNILVTNKYEVG
jgi:hypothetical protein